jgi:hypothetical protein
LGKLKTKQVNRNERGRTGGAMKRDRNCAVRVMAAGILFAISVAPVFAHVNFRIVGNVPVVGVDRHSLVTLTVPNEKKVNNTSVSLEVSDAFLKAGGRLTKVIYAPGWEVKLDKEAIPDDVYQKDVQSRTQQRAERTQNTAPGQAQKPDDSGEFSREWIKKVTFTALPGSAIPPDGFMGFQMIVQVPASPGRYRFAAVQTYENGEQVSWSELMERAEHPAATIPVDGPSRARYIAGGGLALLILLLVWQWAKISRLQKAVRNIAIAERSAA